MGWALGQTLKLFAVSGVRRRNVSFLPQGQSDRRDLAGAEIMERSGASAGHGGRAFEDIFQLVVMIFIQTPVREKFPRALQLAGHEAINPHWCASPRPDRCKPRVAAWCGKDGRLEQSDQQGDSNRAQVGNLSQQSSDRMFPALG